MHTHTYSQLQGGPTCSDTGGLIYAFCGDSGHCAVDYQRVTCPAP